jgi:hypothetical protein
MSFTQLTIPVRPRKGLPFQDIERLVRFSISSPQGTSWYLLNLFRELSLTPHGYVSDMAFEFYIFVRLWLNYWDSENLLLPSSTVVESVVF